MIKSKALLPGVFLRRHKRFITEVRLDSGEIIVAHCPNSGSMKSCLGEGWKVRVSRHPDPKRWTQHTLELIHNGRCWIGINTLDANRIAFHGIEKGLIPGLDGYDEIRREVPYGRHSRVDLLLRKGDRLCYVEVKNVTLVEDGVYLFPDAVTERGQKHLDELVKVRKAGHRAVMLYILQRNDGKYFMPAEAIDPDYARKLRRAYKAGVEILPIVVAVSPRGFTIKGRAEFKLRA
jgi:sugar fermentation stimulation protein A